MLLLIYDYFLFYVDCFVVCLVDVVILVVIYCIELLDFVIVCEYGEWVQYESGIGNSGYYYIDCDGCIECYVFGICVVYYVWGCNLYFIGIELVNLGCYLYWWDLCQQMMIELYLDVQIVVLMELLIQLQCEFLVLQEIVGYEDLDMVWMLVSDDLLLEVVCKFDLGLLFFWEVVLVGCGLW